MFANQNRKLRSLGWGLHAAGLIPLLGIGMLFWLAYAKPLNAEKLAVRQEIDQVTGRLADGVAIRTHHQQLKKRLGDNQDTIALVRDRIPDDAREAEFLRLVTDAARQASLKVDNYSRGQETSRPEFSQLDVHIQASGSFASVCRFIDYLQQVHRVARVVSLQLDSTPRQHGYPLSMTIRLYYGVRIIAASPKDQQNG